MLKNLPMAARSFHRGEDAQMVVFMGMMMFVVFMFFAMSLDAGAWYFDHRTAQNQAEAAALAAVAELPAKGLQTDSEARQAAFDRALAYLEKNRESGLTLGDCPTSSSNANHIEFTDMTGDGKADAVTVCVRRESSGFFSRLSDVDLVRVSASATARVGTALGANVMPWAVQPPAPDCEFGETCEDGEGEACDFELCPFSIDPTKLVVFKQKGGDAVAPGNFGAILACGSAQQYEDCIEGVSEESGFYEEGEDVEVGADTGSNAKATFDGLEKRYASEPDHAACDVPVHPDPVTGKDEDALEAAQAKYTANDAGICSRRLVLVPILESFDNGSGEVHVLAVATFAIIGWDRVTPFNDAEGNASIACGGSAPKTPAPYPCGSVWGFFIRDAVPPDFLLQRIGETNNPFAPLLFALVD
jgi:hypothetical protein